MSTPSPQLRLPRLAGRLSEAAVERARLSVVPRRRKRAARVPFVTLVSLVLLGGVVGLLLFNTSMQQASFAATALEEQATNLEAREQTLIMELDTLRDPQHVAEAAQGLGMVPAGPPAFLDLRTGKTIGNPTPATRDNAFRIHEYPQALPHSLNPPPVIVRVHARAQQANAGSGKNGDTAAQTTGSGAKPRSNG